MNRKIRTISFILLALIVLQSSSFSSTYASAETTDGINNTMIKTDEGLNTLELLPFTYKEYSEQYIDWKNAEQHITINAAQDLSKQEHCEIVDDINKSGKSAVVIKNEGYSEWRIAVPENALYQIEFTYMPASEGNGDVESVLKINGKLPFKEVSAVSFKRTYKQDNDFKTDKTGSTVKPDVNEVFLWRELALCDITGAVKSPYAVGFEAGEHIIRIEGSRGELAIHSIELKPAITLPSYSEYISKYAEWENKSVLSLPESVEGEHFTYKSDLTILPTADRDSPLTNPQSTSSLLLNTIGGNNWKNPGESVTWDFTVLETGLYRIAPRFRQNILDGIFTSRELSIDGEIPFAEAKCLRFNYSDEWQVKPLGEDEPFWFYLEKGTHTLTLTVTMGDVAETIAQVQSSVVMLNSLCRQITMITGSSPDLHRDYNFQNQIPEVIEEFNNQSKLLSEVVTRINEETGKDSSYTSIIKKLIFQLNRMHGNHRSIAKYFEQFRANVGALGTWLLMATEQPLQIDKISFLPYGEPVPEAESGVFSKLSFSFKCFFSSFFTDYNAIDKLDSQEYEETIRVWTQTGRDQAEILRYLTDTDFLKNHKIGVSIELVAEGTLLQSVLAGIGPDVALDNVASDPINYAIRGAVADMTQFDDYKEVAKRFSDSAVVPYSYKSGVYGLPQTFSFLMFFYRADIFAELGLLPPKTWDNVIDMIPDLQRRNMTMAMPLGITGYSLILYQNGGELYTDDMRSNLKSNTALGSFEEFTELFTLYDLPVGYDFANRFRTGEMPCGIQDYSLYNQLSVFAPEIKGLWDMVPVPGKTDVNGKVNNVSVGTGIAAVILNGTGKEKVSWEFLKWLTSTKIQSAFAWQMESVLGTGAKYPTANTEALTQMTWSGKEYKNLLAQIPGVRAVPELPGSYYLPRTVDFAFNRVYNGSGEQNMAENPLDVLPEYTEELNAELQRKQREFEK